MRRLVVLLLTGKKKLNLLRFCFYIIFFIFLRAFIGAKSNVREALNKKALKSFHAAKSSCCFVSTAV